ncbi:MAG: hypothetical protein ACI8RD_007678 [Bacillariaceae sp.]|jgi:hypothetical protein
MKCAEKEKNSTTNQYYSAITITITVVEVEVEVEVAIH